MHDKSRRADFSVVARPSKSRVLYHCSLLLENHSERRFVAARDCAECPQPGDYGLPGLSWMGDHFSAQPHTYRF